MLEKDQAPGRAEYVMESLPYGGDQAETLQLPEKEFDMIAQSFFCEEPIIPSAPTAPCH